MVNGYPLHNSGYDGRGILIAVLDGGFLNADLISSLHSLRNRHGIKRTYDFVRNDEFVFGYHNHGTAVLSVLAGEIDGIIQGTAPGADYMLFRTEDVESEFPVEEDFWVSGAEYADSSGADIISSSLGYYNFDEPTLNYKYSDLDGNSTFISRAADVAASKGILVVNSAGNERNKEWKRIIAPSDGDSVVAVGAVDGNNMISAFSSAGPAADGGIKPDNTTMGVSVTVQTDPASVGRSNGTSFSCPVLSGMAACLMQAIPGVTNTEIIDALHFSSDRYSTPDTLYGYGIPDMLKALKKLQDMHINIPDKNYIAGPNPTTGDIEITFRQEPGHLVTEIISLSGGTIFRQEYEEYAGRVIRLTALNKREQGIYFIRLITERGTWFLKVIKLNR
jgi:subtilisin family serine protease